MPPRTVGPPYDQLLATAEEYVRDHPEADPTLVRDVFREVAVRLDDGLVLDGLDEHDAAAAVALLCEDLVAADPAAAVRGRCEGLEAGEGAGLHEPEVVAAALRIVVTVLQL